MVVPHATQSSCVSGISNWQYGHGERGSFSSTSSHLRTIFAKILLCSWEIGSLEKLTPNFSLDTK